MLYSDMTRTLYHSGPLMYVHVCIELRCLVTGEMYGGREQYKNERERIKKEREGGKGGGKKRE